MKKLLFALPLLLWLASCRTTPTPTEQHFFDIKTNYVPHVVVITNAGPTITNILTITNLVPEYVFTPGTNATKAGEIGRAIGEPFGVGGIVATVIAGLFAGWAEWRNRRNQSKSAALAGVLVQAIETGSEILKTTPQGAGLDAQWKQWMMTNQRNAGVLTAVLDLLDDVVDNESAREVAAKLLALMKERQQPPTS